jgi:hypothetical protein
MNLIVSRKWLWVLVIVVVLITIRALLPHIVLWYVNGELERMEDYDGHVKDVDLAIIRGAYQIKDIEIVKADGNVPVPLFKSERIDLSVLWSAIFRGSLVAEIDVHNPVINFVDSEVEAEKQVGDEPWQDIVENLFPLQIDELRVHNGTVHFRNFTSEPPVDVYLQNMQATITNLTNSQNFTGTRVATVDMSAVAMKQGDLAVDMQFNPFEPEPLFELNVRLKELDMTTMNEFIDAYANFELEAGTLDLSIELAGKDGRVTGYIKPVLNGVKVFNLRSVVEDHGANIFRIMWEGLVGVIATIFSNLPEDQIATEIPIDGEIDDPEAGIWPTITSAVRNAFVQAIEPGVRGEVSIDDVPTNGDRDDNSD